ncbi:MAG: MmgE/PrpD family protein [Oscillibacter sp.]|nr:MmgE/PrpD family protein [Oscillibacter sp.]
MKKVSDAFVDFALEYKDYDRLPPEIATETKRILLNSLGIAVGGLASDKGKIGIQMAKKMGGVPESTLIGVGGKFSAPVAAFANAELLNGLDMDALPHIPPIVIPAVLAVAEAQNASGKELIAAMSVGQELARRLSKVLLSIMTASIMKYGKTPDIFGNSNEHIIGAAIGCGLLMGLTREQLLHALGISAYYCSLPVCRDWESTIPKSMVKYVPVSWMAQGAVQAAEIASLGYTGNPDTLDSEFGFPAIYCREPVWSAEKVLDKLGEEWFFTSYHYKPYPCCRFLHSSIDCFYRLMEKHHFSPNEIESVDCHTSAFVAHPDQYAVNNQVDAQFSGPYCIALAAHNYKPGPAWQDKAALTDPAVQAFMRKVTMHVAPEYSEKRKKDMNTWYARVEIAARGEKFVEETDFSWGTNVDGYRLTDEEQKTQFRTCAAVVLPDDKIERAIDLILHLEDQPSLDELMSCLSL